jgi:hypothetical protein
MIIAFSLIGLISAFAVAAGETVDMGPASVSIDLENIGSYAVEMEGPYSLDHNYDPMNSDFQYTIYPARIKYDDFPNQVLLEVHQMSILELLDRPISEKDTLTGLEHCLEQADMMPRGVNIQTESYALDGRQGILATVDHGDGNPLYILAYSPDQEGGSGTIVCIVGSNFPWETTKSIFASIETQVA